MDMCTLIYSLLPISAAFKHDTIQILWSPLVTDITKLRSSIANAEEQAPEYCRSNNLEQTASPNGRNSKLQKTVCTFSFLRYKEKEGESEKNPQQSTTRETNGLYLKTKQVL